MIRFYLVCLPYWILVRGYLQGSENGRVVTIENRSILYPELSFLLRLFYKIFVKFRNGKKNVLKIVLIIVNIY
jgi:hypothetical protein